MTKIFSILVLAVAATTVACNKESAGTDYDFSNGAAPYAALSSTDDIEVVQGDTAAVKFIIRTAFNKPDQTVTLTYNVSGAITLTDQTVTIPRNTLSSTIEIVIPDGIITDPAADATLTAVVALTKAVTSDGQTLRIGIHDDPSEEMVNVVITK